VRPVVRRLTSGRAPWFLTWALTDRCNYTCDHCGCWRVPGDELTADEARAYAHAMVREGVLGANLCGGEVLLRKDLGEVVAILRDGGVLTRITTNGRLLPARIDELRGINRVKISLDGPPDLHDAVRGEGAFDAVVTALDVARAAGIGVQLNTVLTAGVVARVDEVLDVVSRLDCTVSFNPIEVRHDVAEHGVDAARPATEAYRAVIDGLIAAKGGGDRRIANSVGTLRILRRWPDASPVDCGAGVRFARVLSDGRVVACDRPYAPHPPPSPGVRDFGVWLDRLERAGHCTEGCWRNNTIELNRLLAGGLDALPVAARWT